MTRAADIARADVEESKRSGPPDSAAGRGWSAVILVVTDLFDYLDWQQQRPRAGAGKVVRLTPQAPCLRAAGPPTTSAARGVGGARRRGDPRRPAHHSAPARGGRSSRRQAERTVRDPTTGTPPESCWADRPEQRAVKERNAQIYATIRLVS